MVSPYSTPLSGDGFLLYTENPSSVRFAANPPFVLDADHFVGVRFINNQWEYGTNLEWFSFTPVPSDRLLAAIDFTADTITGLQGPTSIINGINAGYTGGDLTFIANSYGGNADAESLKWRGRTSP